jgi:hypothetical protein
MQWPLTTSNTTSMQELLGQLLFFEIAALMVLAGGSVSSGIWCVSR